MFSIMAILIFAYTRLVLFYHTRVKGRRSEKKKKEWLLFKKALAISGSFVFSWSFLVAIMTYSVTTGNVVSIDTDLIICAVVVLNPLLNAYILWNYDAKVRQNFRELVAGNFFYQTYFLKRSSSIQRPLQAPNSLAVEQRLVKKDDFSSLELEELPKTKIIENEKDMVRNAAAGPCGKSANNFHQPNADVAQNKDTVKIRNTQDGPGFSNGI